jgi:hypothetical protein
MSIVGYRLARLRWHQNCPLSQTGLASTSTLQVFPIPMMLGGCWPACGPGLAGSSGRPRAIELGKSNPPSVVQGDALETLPRLLAGLGDGQIVVLNSWSFAYFSVEQRQAYVELLADVGRNRPLVWLCMDAPGVVELPAGHSVPSPGSIESDLLSSMVFDGESAPRTEVLAFVQSHGQSVVWRGST